MNSASDQSIPVLTPPVAFLGKEQRIVIECAADFPHNKVTVDVLDKGERRGLLSRQSATVLGPRTCKIELPIFEREGDYLLVLRFNGVQDKHFPEIPLCVLSPLEAIQHCIPVSSEHIEKAPVMAAVVAYLIQCGRIGRWERPGVGDEILCQILQCMYARKLPIMSVPGFLCDRYYGGHETLLHLALRLRLEQTSLFLLTDDIITNYKGLLDLQGYDKKRPLEIAIEKGLSEISERMLTVTTAVQDYPRQEKSGSDESDHWEQQQQHTTEGDRIPDSSSDEHLTARSKLKFLSKSRLGQMCKTTLVGAKQVLNRRHTQPSKMGSTESQETFEGPVVHCSRSVTEENSVENSPLKESRQTWQKPVERIKQDCIYKRMIISDYVALDEANNSTRLQIGDIAHVVEEFRMCKGVVNNVFCQFPLGILSPLWEDKKFLHKPAQDPFDPDEDKGYAPVGCRLPHAEDVLCGQGGSSSAYAALVRETFVEDGDYEDLDTTTMCLSSRQKEYRYS